MLANRGDNGPPCGTPSRLSRLSWLSITPARRYRAIRASRRPSQRAAENAALLFKIRRVYNDSKGRYGSPRVYQALRRKGEVVGENRVARLMQSKHQHYTLDTECIRFEGRPWARFD